MARERTSCLTRDELSLRKLFFYFWKSLLACDLHCQISGRCVSLKALGGSPLASVKSALLSYARLGSEPAEKAKFTGALRGCSGQPPSEVSPASRGASELRAASPNQTGKRRLGSPGECQREPLSPPQKQHLGRRVLATGSRILEALPCQGHCLLSQNSHNWKP